MKIFLLLIILNFSIFASENLDTNKNLIKISEKQEIESNKKDDNLKKLISEEVKNQITENKKNLKKFILKEMQVQIDKNDKNNLTLVYNIDQIYKNAKDFYGESFNHLKWIVGIIGSIITVLIGSIGVAQYLFISSERKESKELKNEVTNRIDSFEDNVIKKAQQKAEEFFLQEEKKLKDEMEEIKKKQDIELDKLKKNNLYFEFKFEFISIQTFEQRTDLRLEKLEQLLENEKYKGLDNFDVLYYLEKEYREKYLSRDYDENFGDKYIQLYKKIIEDKKFKERVGDKYKEILGTCIQVLGNFEKVYELERVINKEKEYIPEKVFKNLTLWVNVKLKRKEKVLNLIKEVDLEEMSFDNEGIDYIISILDSKIDSTNIEILKQKKSEGE